MIGNQCGRSPYTNISRRSSKFQEISRSCRHPVLNAEDKVSTTGWVLFSNMKYKKYRRNNETKSKKRSQLQRSQEEITKYVIFLQQIKQVFVGNR